MESKTYKNIFMLKNICTRKECFRRGIGHIMSLLFEK